MFAKLVEVAYTDDAYAVSAEDPADFVKRVAASVTCRTMKVGRINRWVRAVLAVEPQQVILG